ncbi:hypothetical protein HHL16_13955 [Pseudoflavitalea sp. G-6-1-2]|uniref:DUF937 domain-containing protein n=1 Tax=Pseudoflavitalea sp. G-6-1-2 TaxID=2728841 RepID=UPI00146AFD5F|nr:DUF937 domain-containing protein [Pseudoflavitalea sp. G-6-1-2]NML21989.1 hypothetical protein [Pseudoflavitalea sp. G-6-1-2]
MIEQLMSMVKQSSQEVVEQNPDIPNEQNETVSNIASESIIGSIQNMIGNGGASDLMSMFSGGGADENHPVMQTVNSDLTGNLANKLGISGAQASGIASSILPMIISKLFNKSGSGGGGFDLSSLIGSFTGGQGGGGFDLSNITSMLGGGALDINKDGKTDLKDLTDAIGGGKSDDAKKDTDGGGGILDNLSGLFGK